MPTAILESNGQTRILSHRDLYLLSSDSLMPLYNFFYRTLFRAKDAIDGTGIYRTASRLRGEQFIWSAVSRLRSLLEYRRSGLVELLIHMPLLLE